MSELRAKNLNVGDRVRHTTFGEGLVTKYEPSTGDVIITIAFASDNESKRFLLSHTPMEKIEEYKAPPGKIDKCEVSRTYTTEFKIKVVKQALSEGRAVVRKHYKLPETTLRSWIKQFNK